jgi:hypothetical protein
MKLMGWVMVIAGGVMVYLGLTGKAISSLIPGKE